MIERIMIVGCPRSGTTILQSILSSHPDVLGIFETHFYSSLCSPKRWKRKLGLTPRTAIDILKEINQEHSLYRSINSNALLVNSASNIFINLLDYAASNANKKVWVEKTPQHLLYIDYIKKYTSGVRFIHIERKAESVIASIYHASMKYPEVWSYNSIEKSFELWKLNYIENRKYQNSKDHIFVTLSELIDDPNTTLKRLFQFMGIEFIKSLEEKKSTKFATINQNNKEWLFESQNPLKKKEHCRFKETFNRDERLYISNKIKETLEMNAI